MNPRVAAIQPSVIRAIALKKQPGAIDLGLGEPTLLPQRRFIDAAARWSAEHGVRYTVNAGDFELRGRIAAHYAYPGMSEASNVCITTGSQEAVFVAIKTLLDPAADELLVVDPAFPAYAKMAQLEGIASRRVHMRADGRLSVRRRRDRRRARPRDPADRHRVAIEPHRARAARRGRASFSRRAARPPRPARLGAA